MWYITQCTVCINIHDVVLFNFHFNNKKVSDSSCSLVELVVTNCYSICLTGFQHKCKYIFAQAFFCCAGWGIYQNFKKLQHLSKSILSVANVFELWISWM